MTVGARAFSLHTCESVGSGPFDLRDEAGYRAWREAKLAALPRRPEDLVVEIADPRALDRDERQAMLRRIEVNNLAIYRSPERGEDETLVATLGLQLGLRRLDANWLAEEDGISRIEVSTRRDGKGGFIPYTARPIRWHTDGYYQPPGQTIRGMILHCVRPAARGGETTLLDHELLYIALRDLDPEHVRVLMQPDVMLIPERAGDDGVARGARTGPVFSVDAGRLHMRYTARTRSIEWKPDPAVRRAVEAVETLLAGEPAGTIRLRLTSGMGVVAHNVLHDRAGFEDDPAAPRLLLRARYLDRCAAPEPAVAGH